VRQKYSARQRSGARQRRHSTHGNEQRTAKRWQSARQRTQPRQRLTIAHDKEHSHGKDAFAVWQTFAVRKQAFSFFFHFCFILFTTYVYFSISFIFC
jgi:hypothetical protein